MQFSPPSFWVLLPLITSPGLSSQHRYNTCKQVFPRAGMGPCDGSCVFSLPRAKPGTLHVGFFLTGYELTAKILTNRTVFRVYLYQYYIALIL